MRMHAKMAPKHVGKKYRYGEVTDIYTVYKKTIK